MAKRPVFNPGAGRPLPDVDPNPDTNPAAAALASGAAVQTEHISGQQRNSVPLKPPMHQGPTLEKARFSLLESDMDLLSSIASEYRRATGLEVNPSRIVKAAVRHLADHPDRLQMIDEVEELKPGRKARKP